MAKRSANRQGRPGTINHGPMRNAELIRALPGWKHALLTVAVMSGILNLLLLSGSLFMLLVYDQVLPARSLPSLVGLTGLLILAYLFQAGLDQLRQKLAAAAGDLAADSLSDRVFAMTLRFGAPRDGLPGPRDPAQAIRDLDGLRGFLSGPGPLALLDLPWVILFVGVLFFLHWVLGLTCLLGAILLLGLTVANDRMSAAGVEAATRTNAERFLFLACCHRNSDAIRALGMETGMRQGWRRLTEAHTHAGQAATHRLGAVRVFSRTFRLMLQSIMLATGAALVIGGQATGGAIIAASVLSSRALAPIDSAIANWRGLIAARQAWARLAEWLSACPAETERTALPRPMGPLAVDRVAMVAGAEARVVFRDVSFTLTAGDGLAIVGASGSGKSTLARTLVGLLTPATGTVRLDGAALDHWELSRLGQHIGYLPQDIELLDGSIAANISRFAADARDEEIVAAAKAAGVHDLILHLPAGYDTAVGPNGVPLSAGQRQRLALARALFRDPFLIVLDEPNANLDAAGDIALNRAIAQARARGAIVILVAHRPSALVEVDLLLWLENGTVRALGPKADLLPRLTAPGAAPSAASPSYPERHLRHAGAAAG